MNGDKAIGSIRTKVKSYNKNSSTNLVGVKTNAYSLCGLSSNVWITGIANAPVLPDPVSARPMISFPEKKFITATWYQHLFTWTEKLQHNDCLKYGNKLHKAQYTRFADFYNKIIGKK